MQLKIPILTSIIVLTTVLAIPLATHPTAANTGFGVDDPGNVWVPYGPWGVSPATTGPNKLLMHFYSSETVEFTNFELGQLDVLDWEAPQSKFTPWANNPDFLLTPTQGQFGDFGIYFNGASSTWGNWGCTWIANAQPVGSTGIQVYNNTRQVDSRGVACDVNMRDAFAHLIDRPRWTVDGILQGTAQALADDSPPAKAPAGSSLAEQCSWDKMFPNCISAFNIAPDPGGFAAPGSPDFCAAADHMIAAGIATGKQASSCILTGVNSGVFSHPLRFMIRNDKPPRLQFGNGEMNAINQLFGGVAVQPTYGNIRQIGFPIVFSEPPESIVDDWDAYTYGYGLPSPYPDHLFPFYYSLFATDYCGGLSEPEPNNVQFLCNTAVDAQALTTATTADVPTFIAATTQLFHQLGSMSVDIPVYADGVRLGALRSVAGLVNLRGAGYTNGATMLYARQDTSYTPVCQGVVTGSCPSGKDYRFGGGDPTTLRWGQASGTLELNPFHAQTVWEFNVLLEVYDSLFTASPIQLDHTYCNVCTSASSTPSPPLPYVAGDQFYDVQLRRGPDGTPLARWQDGTPITAHDVAFSALNLARYSANLGSGLLLLRGVKVVSDSEVIIEWQGQSISYPIDMEFLLLPSHIWEDSTAAAPVSCAAGCVWGASQGAPGDGQLISTDIHPAAASMRDSTYDPIAHGTFIGSGPWACVSVFPQDVGKIGTGCSQSASGQRIGQAIGIDGRMQLAAFDFLGQPGNSDPFYQYYRSSNPAWGTGSGVTAQSGAFQQWNWDQKGDTGRVSILDLASAASCFGAGPSGTSACPSNITPANTCSPNCPYNYWNRAAFETTPGTISGEPFIVYRDFDNTFISPYWPWTTTTLENIVVFTH
ncbi:MAG: hypothetical protein AUJ07_10515 [Crenarchaeota archaeon 13_1_40CM_3_53_5]|nr:MAG: hypothetical protein AUJ07_10515 [Crenarchaeota archaeon 13_1_40CM_3_53_5]